MENNISVKENEKNTETSKFISEYEKQFEMKFIKKSKKLRIIAIIFECLLLISGCICLGIWTSFMVSGKYAINDVKSWLLIILYFLFIVSGVLALIFSSHEVKTIRKKEKEYKELSKDETKK